MIRTACVRRARAALAILFAAVIPAASGARDAGWGADSPPEGAAFNTGFIAAGWDENDPPGARRFGYPSLAVQQDFFAYDIEFTGGVRIAMGDVNGDGTPDIITGSGPGQATQVRVFNGLDGGKIADFNPFPGGFIGGVFVASGDVNDDALDDIIVGPGAGAPDLVHVFDGRTLGALHLFPAYGGTFTGGVRVGAGDVNGDGFADIITGPGADMTPHVKVFDGVTGGVLHSFFAFNPAFTGGVFVAAGRINSDGMADIITGAGGGVPQVTVFDGVTLGMIHSFFAYPPMFTGGVRVAAGDLNGDGAADIITGAGPGSGPHVKVFDGVSAAELSSFLAFGGSVGGVFVGAAAVPTTPPAPTPTREPSPSPTARPSATPTAAPCCPGDADNSGGAVNANDFLAVQANFGADNGTGGVGDADCSGGAVNANDFLAVQASFGANCD